MRAPLAVLGAGPHGRQIAHDLNIRWLYDDILPGYEPCHIGADLYSEWIAGPVWPDIRRGLVDKVGRTVRGVYVAPSAVVGIETDLGDHVHVLASATISHGCRIGAFSTVATGAVLCGEVTIGEGVFVGAGAVVVHGGITVGDGAFIDAGARVTRDVTPGERVRCSK